MPFVKGQSGNPAGRPVGSRNRFTQEMDKLLEEQGPAVLERIMFLARGGHPAAIRACVERLAPTRKHRQFAIQLPPPDTPGYAMAALAEVHRALGEGEITTEEATRLLGFIERTAEILASPAVAENFTDRVKRLEEAVARCLILLRAAPMTEPEAEAPTLEPSADSADEAAIANNNGETMAEVAEDSPPVAPAAQAPIAKNNGGAGADSALDEAMGAASAGAPDGPMTLTSPLAQTAGSM